jgi:glucose-1-phosphate thymidylyltransferase
MKGIILAGGSGTRLFPITKCISKQLLPIYNKPMIYYPLSVLMLLGIKEVLIISDSKNIKNFSKLLEDGKDIGIKIEYNIQDEPNGIAEAILIGEKFIGKDPVCLALGDNIFYGNDLADHLMMGADDIVTGAAECVVFGYQVKNPQDYGVAEFKKDGSVISIEEKPVNPKTDWAVTGLYMYNNTCVEKTKNLKPSSRNELEITSLNNEYVKEKSLKLVQLGRGHAWFDTGTFESFYEATNFIRSVENRQGLMIGNIHEIAYRYGYTSNDDLLNFINKCGKNDYRDYLQRLVNDPRQEQVQ